MNRILAAIAVVGTLAYAGLSVLHGNPPIDSPEKFLGYVAERPWWLAAHEANILAVVAWLVALTGFAGTLSGSARRFGRIAIAAMTTATAVFAIYFSLHGFGFSTLADRLGTEDDRALYAHADVLMSVLGSVAFTAQALLGLSILLFGVAVTLSDLPRWLGIGGIVAGGGWLVGAVIIDFAVIVPFTALSWIWMLAVAVALWRRPAPADALAA